MVRISRSEQETIITRAADQKTWHVFSEDPTVQRKLTRLHGPGSKVGAIGMEWTVPKPCISFRRPVVLDDSARRARAEALRSARERNAQKPS